MEKPNNEVQPLGENSSLNAIRDLLAKFHNDLHKILVIGFIVGGIYILVKGINAFFDPKEICKKAKNGESFYNFEHRVLEPSYPATNSLRAFVGYCKENQDIVVKTGCAAQAIQKSADQGLDIPRPLIEDASKEDQSCSQ